MKQWNRYLNLCLIVVLSLATFANAQATIYEDSADKWNVTSSGEHCSSVWIGEKKEKRYGVAFEVRGEWAYTLCINFNTFRYYRYLAKKAKEQKLTLVLDTSIKEANQRFYTQGTPQETVQPIILSEVEILKSKVASLEKRLAVLEARQARSVKKKRRKKN